MAVGGIEPPTRIVGQGLTGHCDQIVTLFWATSWPGHGHQLPGGDNRIVVRRYSSVPHFTSQTVSRR